MNGLSDQQLLRDYAGTRSEAAFAELVRRYIDLVYSAAVRMVRDAHLAQDVTQGAFIALAQNAGQLTNRPALSGWLHRTAQNIACKAVRSDVRRRAWELEAATMTELTASESDAPWDQIAPHLDAALGELTEPDRDAVLLRYFERKSAGEMAQTLGISDEAAQKRVSRAVERLRGFLAKRGVAAGASGLVVVISANAVQAAPAGLAATISTSAILGGTALVTATTATKAIAMTALQKTLITATIAAALGTGIYKARQASTLRQQVQTLQQEQARETGQLTEQLSRLKTENERLSNQVAQGKKSQALPQAQANELLRLRNKATLAQAQSRELAQLKSTLAQQPAKVPDFIYNSMVAGAEKASRAEALGRLSRMKQMLNLTDAQEQAIKDIMTNNIPRQSQLAADMILGKATPEQAQAQARAKSEQEAQIKARLTPEQLAAYPEYQQAEKTAAADASATSSARAIAKKYGLTQDQQERLRALFYELDLKGPAGGQNERAFAEASQNGKLAEAVNISVEVQKARLEEKAKILEGFLSPEQMATYRQENSNAINKAQKMFSPRNPADAAN